MSDTQMERIGVEGRKWIEEAACRGANPKLFDAVSALHAEAALRICKACPVKEACLQEALNEAVNPDGVWGGTTQLERRKIRRHGTLDPVPEGQAAINAAKTHCKWGHEFTPANTIWNNGHRSCRKCYNKRLRDRRAATSRKAVAA